MRISIFAAIATAIASPAFAQDVERSPYSLASPVPGEALRELSTDRPDKTESPYTVDAGHVQIELDLVTYAQDRDGDIRTETYGIMPVNLKFGVTGSTDLQLLIDPYVRRAVSDRNADMRQSMPGFGDITLRLKHNLGEMTAATPP